MKCIIFTNGFIDDYKFLNNDFEDCYIIACDGGLKHIDRLNLKPNILIGDFDSVSTDLLYKYSFVKKLQYPRDKDFTDTELSFIHAKEEGYTNIYLYGATGGRLDHTLGNIFLLKKAYNLGLKVKIIDQQQTIQYYSCGQHTLNNIKNKTLSIIPIENINFKKSYGLLYPLDDLSFSVGDTRPISNIVTESEVLINISNGSCLVITTNIKTN